MVKENKIMPVIFLFVLLPFLIAAAEIRGNVKDIYNQPLPGVAIRVGESGQTTLTNEQGAFILSLGRYLAKRATISSKSPQYYQEKRMCTLKTPPMIWKFS